MTNKIFLCLYLSAFAFPVFAIDLSPHAAELPTSYDGIHIHRTGTSPALVKSAPKTLASLKTQCQSLESICATLPADVSPRDTAACAKVAGGFSLEGDVAQVGAHEVDEYFALQPRMTARHVTETVLRVKGPCRAEVANVEKWEIWHYGGTHYTHYEYKDDANNDVRWVRTRHERLSDDTLALLPGAFPLSGTTRVSPMLGRRSYGGYQCEIHEISGRVSGAFCLIATGLPFPAHVGLAGKISARGKTLVEDHATHVELNATLSSALFFPSADAAIEDIENIRESVTDPRRKRCGRQMTKTGGDSCADDSDGNTEDGSDDAEN